MPEGENDPPEDGDKLDGDIEKQAYPLSEGSDPVEIEGRLLAKVILYPHGAKVPENNNELAKLLAKKDKELDTQKKLSAELTKKLAEITAEKVELEKKIKTAEDVEKAELSKELNELREKVGLDKIEKPEELSLEVVRSKMEDAKALSKVEKKPGDPKPDLKKELAEGKDKEEKKKALRMELLGHEDVPGSKKEGD